MNFGDGEVGVEKFWKPWKRGADGEEVERERAARRCLRVRVFSFGGIFGYLSGPPSDSLLTAWGWGWFRDGSISLSWHVRSYALPHESS